jgi:amino acid transporter
VNRADAPLVRAVGLRAATAINVITMIGIGPLITIPLVLGALHGPLSLFGWILGALLSLCDGLVWAELGSLYPHSGGTYGFLLESFGRARLGRLLAFLFVWQTVCTVPLTLASGYVGFANYAGYLFPGLGTSTLQWAWPALGMHVDVLTLVAVGVGVVTIAALYRGIASSSRIGVWLAAAALSTLLAVIAASYTHFSASQALGLPPPDSLWGGLRAGLGSALVITMYDYAGYSTSSSVGGEIVNPATTIPRSILIAIGVVAALYVTMQFGILGAIPWQQFVPLADGSLPPLGQHLASAVVEQRFGSIAGGVVTVLILITAFASLYGNLLGSSRVPYAAAADGVFLRPFAHVHPTHRFPDVSLVAMGVLALGACVFTLDRIINALIAGIVLIQPIAQIAALVALRARGVRAPYRMRWFPLPALLALAGWVWVFVSAGGPAITFGVVSLGVGAVVFSARAAAARQWPFAR